MVNGFSAASFKTHRGVDAKRQSLLRLGDFDLYKKFVDILSLFKRNILISPLEGEKKFLSELCELRNFREGYNLKYSCSVQPETGFEPSPAFVMLTGVRKRLLPLTKREGCDSVISNNFSDTVFSRFTSHFSHKRTAFTLAEVLITIGIIGIVASMTLPTIINNIQNKQLETLFKKSYSIISQVSQRVVMEDYGGEIPDNELWTSLAYYAKYLNGNYCTGTISGGCPANASGTNYCNFMIKNYKDFSGKSNAGCLGNDYVVNVIDGSTYYFDYAGSTEINFGKQQVVVDINGWVKGPNKLGHDMFLFQINRDGKIIAGGDLGSVYPKESYCKLNYSNSNNGYGCTIKAINEKDYFKKLPH